MRNPLSALITVLLLVLAACGGGGGAEEEPSTDETTQGEETSDATSAPEETSADGDPQSLGEFFGWENQDSEAMQADFRDQEARIQESIRQCMAEEGFEYQPMMPPDEAFVVADDFDQEEWTRTHGYGVTTWYGNEEEMEAMGRGGEWVDPNQETVDVMSETEREAWYAALYGTQEEQEEDMEVEVDEETGETFYVSTGFGAGCQGEAYETEYGDQSQSQELWEELSPAMDEMYQRIEADARIVEANQGWSACMAESGYEVTTRNDLWETALQEFQTRFEELVGPNGGYADPMEGWTQEEIDAFFEEKTQEEIDAFYKEAEEASRANVDMDAVRALQQEEIDMAVADMECSEGWDELYQEVSREYEADFIASNRDTLEQIREIEGR